MASNEGYSLCAVEKNTDNWRAFHNVRRTALFKQSEHEYDVAFQDSYIPVPAARTNLLLKFNGEAVGLLSLDDFGDGRAAIRGVAIASEAQGEGHGRHLIEMTASFAESCGVRQICVNAGEESKGFYQRLRFREDEWSSAELDEFGAGRETRMLHQLSRDLSGVSNDLKKKSAKLASVLEERVWTMRHSFVESEDSLSPTDWVREKLRNLAEIDQCVMNYCIDHGCFASGGELSAKQETLAFKDEVLSSNTDELRSILQSCDQQLLLQLGKATISHVWLIAQHADHDREFQAHALEIMHALHKEGACLPSDYAYLHDRVAMNSGRPQRYGTQFTRDTQLYPVEDPQGLDERRRSVGLESIAEYTEVMKRYQASFAVPGGP